jgi:hypothetical protein
MKNAKNPFLCNDIADVADGEEGRVRGDAENGGVHMRHMRQHEVDQHIRDVAKIVREQERCRKSETTNEEMVDAISELLLVRIHHAENPDFGFTCEVCELLAAAMVAQSEHYASDQLEGSFLLGTHLEGPNLTEAVGLVQSSLDDAIGDAETKLPEGLTRPAHWPTG